ncbi:Predicted L-lactate dehydrogenase, Fe-S oxidoreductase subunit YkgE / Predicted L-lactate dehydrogenase, Iron-sulfur cluster-binding subunit YkgF [Halorubrum sp. DM2]|uniref:LUD domain-containing protein n=1 Tax=Halorubrum sp. DM2 TaxID=2527867 RepID=UPI0024B7CD4F|nr:LUD domain-containing protein [Halorubrum sp. DM2]VTT87973.1 Predicted L-lactate dehydrogenase, Fe-S oxidoreductase subunit YkgE / Predicted L-lactate dehydrogenase, Iron-sulfur cluster-binding subunit YkgF [Halorubrum sp. DM2]
MSSDADAATDASTGPKRETKAERIRELLATEGDAVAANTRGFNAGRYESTGRLDGYEALKDEARAIKEDAIERLPDLIDEVRETVEANGGTVYLADDAADANRYIREVAAERDAERAIKSKSMTSEEIEVNDALDADGVEVVETDLGEWVLQLADEEPSHIVAPAIHKSREGISELFAERFDLDDQPETAEELTMFARERLGDLIEDADLGMTGANFIAADSGTMLLVTSEGNARKTVTATDTHVAVAGVEKLVPTVEEFAPFVELIGRSGTGQDVTSYISTLTPPVGSPVPDFEADETPLADGSEDDRAFHLVLIDNGRLAMRDDETLKETLYCIRCSACSNACGNFQSVGGHAFGGETYSGGIATGWEAGIEGLDTAAEFNDLCTGCSRCVPACPVGIDIPWINTAVRDRINRGEADPSQLDWAFEELVPDEEPGGLDLGTRLVGNYATLAEWGHKTAPVANRLANFGPARALAERVVGIDRRRDLPEFARESLVEWFADRGGSAVDPDEADREAVVYPDTATNYVDVERGKATVRALEALGVHVRVPDLPGSGRPPLSQGMVATAEAAAGDVYAGLAPHLDAGRDVVVIEPSDLATFRREYERFLPADSHERLAGASYDAMEYVFGLLEAGGDPAALRAPAEGTGPVAAGRRLAYHPHCQARTVEVGEYATATLERLGYDVRVSDTECCGMAGSFGYKTDYYELSMDVGEPLREQFGDTERTVVAPGTSCTEQLDALLESTPMHPIEVIAPRE